MKLGDKLIILIVGIVFFGIGVGMVIFSGTFKKAEKEFNENAEPVNVYVNEVNIHRSSSSTTRESKSKKTTYTAYVTYEIDGIKYQEMKIHF
jgi:flagellar basal body-associated protein FliL